MDNQDFKCDKCGQPILDEYGLCDVCWEKCVRLGNRIHE